MSRIAGDVDGRPRARGRRCAWWRSITTWLLSTAGGVQIYGLAEAVRTGIHPVALIVVAGTLPLTSYLSLRLALLYRITGAG